MAKLEAYRHDTWKLDLLIDSLIQHLLFEGFLRVLTEGPSFSKFQKKVTFGFDGSKTCSGVIVDVLELLPLKT